MDNQECRGECQPCWEAVQKYLGKSVEMLKGTFESVAIHEDGGRDHHLVVLKIPCSRQQGESNGGGNGPTPVAIASYGGGNGQTSGSAGGGGGLGSFSLGHDSDSSLASGMGGSVGGSSWRSSEEAESLDYADILPEAELNQILADFMEGAEELNAHHSRSDESITVTNEQLLHAAIDKHLGQQSKASNPSMVGEWKSPLFNNVDVGATNAEVIPAIKIKEEPEDEDEIPTIPTIEIKEEPEDEDEEMVDSEPDKQIVYRSASPEQLLPSVPPTYSFATLTTVPSSSNHHPQPIRQHLIPQVTVPMSAVNQVAYAMAAAASQNQILRPANLPAVSALMSGSGNQAFNWALARYSYSSVARTPATIIKANPKAVTAFRPSVLFANPSSTQAPSRPTSNVVAKIRCRKTSPLLLKETNDLPVPATITHKKAADAQFVSRDGGPSLPDGQSFESFILEEGLHKIRRLGLHRNSPDKDDFLFKCPLCDKKYRNPNGIKYHAKYGHGPKSIFTCSICQRDYATRHGLAAHRKTHQVSDQSTTLVSVTAGSTPNRSVKNVTAYIIQAAPRRA